MSDRVQDLTNHRKVAVACKNYTDKEIKASEERILSIVARNNVDFIDHTDEPTYRFTAPANAKLLMLQSIGGNTVKLSPSVASDSTKALIKTMPSTVYTFDGSKFYGDSKVSENLNIEDYMFKTTLHNATYSNGVVTTSTLVNYSTFGFNVAYVSSQFELANKNEKTLFKAGTYYLSFDSRLTELNDNVCNLTPVGGNVILANTYADNTRNVITPTFVARQSINSTTFSRTILSFTLSESSYIGFLFQKGTSTNPSIVEMQRFMISTSNIDYEPYFANIHNIELSGLVVKNSDDEVMQTKTIDLTTIVDSNNNKLFPNGKLMGNENVKDVLGVYNQESKWDEVDLGLQTIEATGIDTHTFKISLSSAKAPSDNDTLAKLLMANYETVTYNSISTSGDMTMALRSDNVFVIRNNAYSTAESFKTAMSGVKLQYERATYLTSNTDLSATLRNIQGYPNGSIIAENTYNMDVESVITYNSIIQETLCPSITITRNGVDILTRNLPTQASDGYSAGTQRNYRVFCDDEGNEVLKRETNVGKENMKDLSYGYNSTYKSFYAQIEDKTTVVNSNITSLVSRIYTVTNSSTDYNTIYSDYGDMAMGGKNGNNYVYLTNEQFTDTTTFANAMDGEPLYYVKNATAETDMDDFDYFFDVEEGDIITFNNPYAQQVYATYSFLIKEAKSNE